jgi:type III secretory pathway component EscT
MVVASAATMPASLLEGVASVFQAARIDLAALGHAWARVLPIVVIVPAFGLRALPLPARAVIALALAAAITAAVPNVALGNAAHVTGLLDEVTRGLSIAIAAAVPLWAATMAGGLIDALRGGGASGQGSAPTVEGRPTQMGVLLSILASAIFLAGGGAARVVAAVARPETAVSPVLVAAHDLVAGITLAVALGAPVLVASIIVDVAGALLARTASPAQMSTVLAPVRALVVLVVVAVSVDRIAEGIALAMR